MLYLLVIFAHSLIGTHFPLEVTGPFRANPSAHTQPGKQRKLQQGPKGWRTGGWTVSPGDLLRAEHLFSSWAMPASQMGRHCIGFSPWGHFTSLELGRANIGAGRRAERERRRERTGKFILG